MSRWSNLIFSSHRGWYGWAGMRMLIMPLILGVGVILSGIYLRSRKRRSNVFNRKNTGLEILRESYARGEIDSAEFQSRKQDLENR